MVLSAEISVPDQTVPQMIVSAAVTYGVDPQYALRIAFCESEYKEDARNPNSSAKGVFQFIDGTWASVNRIRGLSYDVMDAEQNIDNAMWLVQNEGWHHWECVHKI